MATYSNLGIKLIGTGDEAGTWGTSTNDNFEFFDNAIVGHATVTLVSAGSSGSPNQFQITDFTASDARKRVIEFNDAGDLGADAYVQIDPNDFVGYWFIRNSLSGSRSIYIFQGSYDAARDYVIPAGTDVVLRCTGGGATSYVYSVLENLKLSSIEVNSVITTGLDLGGQKITNLGTPTAGTDAATKAYVDAAVSGIQNAGIVFASGNQILFRGASVPSGWSIVAQNNKALRIVSGTPSSGGSNVFSTAFNSARTTGAGSAHSHGVGTLAGSFTTSTTGGAGGGVWVLGGSTQAVTISGSTGSESSHTHTLNLDVQYYDMNIIQKT